MYWLRSNNFRRTWKSALRALILVAGLLLFETASFQVSAQTLPAQVNLAEAYKNYAGGFVFVKIKFAPDGKVQDCGIIRSNVPFSLEASTVDFIKQHWRNQLFAGATVTLPITYQVADSTSAHWNEDIAPPPNPLTPDDPERKLKLRVTFGDDAWVKDAQVVETSGSDSVDHQTLVWVRVHWHHQAYANQVIDAPIVFKALPSAAPVAAAPPVPVAPPPPPEPAPIPAIRAE